MRAADEKSVVLRTKNIFYESVVGNFENASLRGDVPVLLLQGLLCAVQFFALHAPLGKGGFWEKNLARGYPIPTPARWGKELNGALVERPQRNAKNTTKR